VVAVGVGTAVVAVGVGTAVVAVGVGVGTAVVAVGVGTAAVGVGVGVGVGTAMVGVGVGSAIVAVKLMRSSAVFPFVSVASAITVNSFEVEPVGSKVRVQFPAPSRTSPAPSTRSRSIDRSALKTCTRPDDTSTSSVIVPLTVTGAARSFAPSSGASIRRDRWHRSLEPSR